MKQTFKIFTQGILLFSLSSICIVHAQEEPPKEFALIRLVNGMAHGTGNLTLKIDGENVYSNGYKLGAVTGGIAVRPGIRQVTVSKEGIEEGTASVNAPVSSTVTIIPFAEKVEATEDKPEHWQAKVLRLRQMDPISARTITFVSVASADEIKVETGIDGENWTTGYVKRLTLIQLPIEEAGGYTRIRIAGTEIKPTPVPTEGNYIMVLYENADGEIMSEKFLDQKVMISE